MMEATSDGLVHKRSGKEISIPCKAKQYYSSLLIAFSFATADRQQMQALVCLAELEGLHIQQSASTFDKCNKEGLVRGLWRNHKHERKVRVIDDYLFFCFVVVVVFWEYYYRLRQKREGKGVRCGLRFRPFVLQQTCVWTITYMILSYGTVSYSSC